MPIYQFTKMPNPGIGVYRYPFLVCVISCSYLYL